MMQRRSFLKSATFAGFVAGLEPLLFSQDQAATAVHTVLLVCKCHLDVGFTMTQAKVMRQYFDVYFPAAIKTAADLRAVGSDRYTWTTGSWLLYEYLEQATGPQRKAMEQAIAAGDIAWHGLPFSWQSEMLTASMIRGALSFSKVLDARFGVLTTGAKMTDVPGHTRGLISPLADGGIELLDIGVNAASTPPDVPAVFLWQDAAGKTLPVLYHREDYGGVVRLPGTKVVAAVEVRGDNSGPHTPAEIAAIHAKLRTQFPAAIIKPATLNDVAAALASVRADLPVVTGEIGDTWIYGCSSDPMKVASFRTVMRLRERWLASKQLVCGDATDRNLLRHLLLGAEHTWGTDTKSYLDDRHYRPADLAKVLTEPGYVVMQTSWQEKRDNLKAAVETLNPPLRKEAEAELQGLIPHPPETAGMQVHVAALPIETRYFTLRLDPQTGAIYSLVRDGLDWAAPDSPLALLTYQTLGPTEYSVFLKRYLTAETEWGPKDFGKPGIADFDAQAHDRHPRLVRCLIDRNARQERLLLELAFEDQPSEVSADLAMPSQVFVELLFSTSTATVELHISTFGKQQNRLPEALWLTFRPKPSLGASWDIEKSGQRVAATEVVRGGGRAMHATTGAVRAQLQNGRVLRLEPVDSAIVAMGVRSPLNFTQAQPDMTAGVHFSLFNNAWGTNYPQWAGGNWLYRFRLEA